MKPNEIEGAIGSLKSLRQVQFPATVQLDLAGEVNRQIFILHQSKGHLPFLFSVMTWLLPLALAAGVGFLGVHCLQVGKLVLMKRAQEVPSFAVAKSIHGNVSLWHNQEGAEKMTLSQGEKLKSGDTIQTNEDGTALLVFENGSRLHMDPETTLTIHPAAYVQAAQTTYDYQLTLKTGRIFNQVIGAVEGMMHYEVLTPDALVITRGTLFEVSNFESSGFQVAILDGKVEVRPTNRERMSRTIESQERGYMSEETGERFLVSTLSPEESGWLRSEFTERFGFIPEHGPQAPESGIVRVQHRREKF